MNRKDNRRSILGLVVRPREQLRMAASITGWAVLITFALVISVVISLRGFIERWSDMTGVDAEVASIFRNSLVPALGLVAFTLIALALLVLFLIVKRSHRYYGPLIPIQRHIDNMIKGDFTSRVHLRDGDEMMELRDSLNKLAETLQSGKR